MSYQILKFEPFGSKYGSLTPKQNLFMNGKTGYFLRANQCPKEVERGEEEGEEEKREGAKEISEPGEKKGVDDSDMGQERDAKAPNLEGS